MGAFAGITVVVFLHIQIAIFFVWPPPNTVTGWFALFHSSSLVGLLDMDLLLIVDYVLLLAVFVAFWAALGRYNQSLMTIALVLQIVSAATYFSSAVAFEMLSLSSQYYTAATESQKSTILTAGSILLATWQGTAFDVSYVLGCAATLIVSVSMLRSQIFSRTAAYFGIGAGMLMVLPPSAGSIALIMSLASIPPMAIWLGLSARRLWKLASVERGVLSRQT